MCKLPPKVQQCPRLESDLIPMSNHRLDKLLDDAVWLGHRLSGMPAAPAPWPSGPGLPAARWVAHASTAGQGAGTVATSHASVHLPQLHFRAGPAFTHAVAALAAALPPARPQPPPPAGAQQSAPMKTQAVLCQRDVVL